MRHLHCGPLPCSARFKTCSIVPPLSLHTLCRLILKLARHLPPLAHDVSGCIQTSTCAHAYWLASFFASPLARSSPVVLSCWPASQRARHQAHFLFKHLNGSLVFSISVVTVAFKPDDSAQGVAAERHCVNRDAARRGGQPHLCPQDGRARLLLSGNQSRSMSHLDGSGLVRV